ncbi:MAG: hypothetical protein ABR551_13720 [Gemmatimonadales bacterium]
MPNPRLSRALMWLFVILAIAWLVVAIRAARVGDSGVMASGFLGTALLLVVAAWIGIRGARLRARQQAAQARHAARMILMAELGRHDDATLERIASSSGPAAEAALMILQGRHLGNPAGSPKHSAPGS